MRNLRYAEQAIAELRAKGHLSERSLALSDDELLGITLSVYNVAQEIAKQHKSDVVLDLDDEVLIGITQECARQDITLNEFVEHALQMAIYDAKAKLLYEENGGDAWETLTDEAKNEWYIRSSVPE